MIAIIGDGKRIDLAMLKKRYEFKQVSVKELTSV